MLLKRAKLVHMPTDKYGWCDGVAVWTVDPFTEEVYGREEWEFYCDCELWESLQEI